MIKKSSVVVATAVVVVVVTAVVVVSAFKYICCFNHKLFKYKDWNIQLDTFLRYLLSLEKTYIICDSKYTVIHKIQSYDPILYYSKNVR